MNALVVEMLECPKCKGAFRLNKDDLVCAQCENKVPIRNGIPRFVSAEVNNQTAENFGAQWLEFDQFNEKVHQQQFLDWIHPVTPEFIRDKIILEAGCGNGRHTRLVASWGAKAVIGVDFSNAVEAARRNTEDLPNVQIIQADILSLPFKRVFDYAFSVGVLHHLPDPRLGFLSLAACLRSGGAVSAWVYGRENNEWITGFVNPIREQLTSKLPFSALYYLSYVPSSVLYAMLRMVYAPARRRNLDHRLFYGDYLGYISQFPFREIHNIVHDHLTAPIAFYISREEFEGWYEEVKARDVEISWHNRNSWRGFGVLPSPL